MLAQFSRRMGDCFVRMVERSRERCGTGVQGTRRAGMRTLMQSVYAWAGVMVVESAAYRSRSGDTVWLRRCAWLSHPLPFSSTYVTSRVLAMSRYRPTTHPQDSVLKPSSLTTLMMSSSTSCNRAVMLGDEAISVPCGRCLRDENETDGIAGFCEGNGDHRRLIRAPASDVWINLRQFGWHLADTKRHVRHPRVRRRARPASAVSELGSIVSASAKYCAARSALPASSSRLARLV
jgi:hypothetical protein